MYNNEKEIDNAQAQWMLNRRFTADATTNALIRGEVENYLEEAGGYPAPAHFERFYLQLLNDGKIQPFKGSLAEQPVPAPLIPKEIIDYITSPKISAFEQRKRYANDKEFKRCYDLYATMQLKAQVAAEEKEETLTVEQYNAMPRIDVVKKYRSSASFRRGVDALIAKGLIALVLGLLLHGGMI
jgi:hypothetical protein